MQSLEQRRSLQLLKIIYQQSRDPQNVKIATRPTRAADKIVFNVPSKCTTKYLNSPYYQGIQLCNQLSEQTQRMENRKKFERKIAPLYKTYRAPTV